MPELSDPLIIGLLVFLGILLGLVLGVLAARSRDAGARGHAEAERVALRERLEEYRRERDEALARVESTHSELAALQSRSAADAERLAWLEQAESRLRETFESLASRTLSRSTQQLTSQSRAELDQFSRTLKSDWNTQREQLSGLMKPMGEELKRLDGHIRALEEKRQGAYEGLTEQIGMIAQQHRALQQATSSLDQALRAPNVRGKWGEVQLRRLVELAGMSEHVDFDEQQTGSAQGRPDLVVHLPSRAIMPVDSKAPMSAYLESQEAASPELAAQALKRHASALRAHVQALAGKAYWKQFERAPEFVVLLIPYESGLSAAFRSDPALLEDALASRVIIASPASFLALLRVIAYGWMQIQLSENAAAISREGRELLDRLGPFAEHLNKLGSSINQAAERFNDAAGSFERRILPTARRLHELGAASDPPGNPEQIEGHARRIQHDGG